MATFLVILTILILLGFTGFFYFFNRRLKKMEEGKNNDQSLLMIQGQLQGGLGEIRQSILETTRNLTEKLGKLDQTNQQIVGFADQLQNLQDILKNQKQRGILGEYFLEAVLKNVLPPKSYQMQYLMGVDEETGQNLIVDAVIFVRDKLIPIDSKFSLENYNRLIDERDPEKIKQWERLFKQDLKNRIDETSKYIKPQKNTFEFAFMFIPSEAIYYDLLVDKVGAIKSITRDLIEYAYVQKRVIIVSPTTFLAYLQMVIQGLKTLQIEERAKEFYKNVEELNRKMLKYDSYFKKLGQNLGRTVSTYNEAHKEFERIDKNVLRITKEKREEVETLSLDEPRYD